MCKHAYLTAARRLAWLALLSASASWAGPVHAGPVREKLHTVLIEGTQFSPTRLEVQRGDTVVWKNQDPFPHTVTADGGQFDSGALAPETTWKFVANKSGSFPYTCTLHKTMKGVLIVK